MQRILGKHKGACYTLPITQFSIATKYLRAHLGEVGLVTNNLGFNNIRPCLTPALTNESCVNRGIVAVRNDLPTIVSRLQNAAGPLVYFVGLEYSDPFLAYYLDGSAGRVIAQRGLVAMNEMNSVLSMVYRARSVPVADVPAASLSSSVKPVTMTNVGTVPKTWHALVRVRGCARRRLSDPTITPTTLATSSLPALSQRNSLERGEPIIIRRAGRTDNAPQFTPIGAGMGHPFTPSRPTYLPCGEGLLRTLW